MKKPGLVVVISSPSGTGKTTVCRQLIKRYRDYQFSISATTRSPRKTEKDGVDYFFMTTEEFLDLKKAGMFAETARYLEHWYGTPKAPLEKTVNQGKIVLLDIDIQGGRSIKKTMPNAVTVFLIPPSLTELKKRLKGRHTEEPSSLQMRLKKAVTELSSWSYYDYAVVNDELKSAVKQIHLIIEAERHKAWRLADKKYWKKSIRRLLGLG